MSDCLFCKIIAGEIPSNKVYEDEQVYVFEDSETGGTDSRSDCAQASSCRTQGGCTRRRCDHRLLPHYCR